MPLAFVRPSATAWVLLPAGSGSILCTPPSLQWVPRSLFIWYWLSGGICGNISRRPSEIPGIIYKKMDNEVLILLIHFNLLTPDSRLNNRLTISRAYFKINFIPFSDHGQDQPFEIGRHKITLTAARFHGTVDTHKLAFRIIFRLVKT